MNAAENALADLLEVSSQIEAAVLFDESGAVSAATVDDDAAARLVRIALDVGEAAGRVRPRADAPVRVHAVLEAGGFVVARDGNRLIAATTTPDADPALVAYDLGTCLRRSAPAPKRARRPKKEESNAPA